MSRCITTRSRFFQKVICNSKVRSEGCQTRLPLWKVVNFMVKNTNVKAAKWVYCTRCQICFNNRYSSHMYIEIHVYGKIVMHTAAAAEWEWSIIRGERKTEMKTVWERASQWERERERKVGYELELWAVGSRSVQLSQSWLMMEAVKIHLLPAHYNFILEPGALELT